MSGPTGFTGAQFGRPRQASIGWTDLQRWPQRAAGR